MLLALVLLGQLLVAEVRGSFRASCVKVDITPEDPQWLLGYQARQSTGIHDRLYHRIVAMDDGAGTTFYLVSTDICETSPAEYDKIVTELARRTDIQPRQVWWTFTHTHSAPEVGPPGLAAAFLGERYQHTQDEAYSKLVEEKLIDGIRAARNSLQPARLGVGWGASSANINRRARDVDGSTTLGMNPDGPVDRRIGLIRLERTDGRLLALIANYPMHGTVLGGANLLISGDAPGVVAEYVEKRLSAPLLFINGAAGDLAPIYSVYPNPRSGHLSQFRVLLGDKIIEANRLVSSATGTVRLDLWEGVCESPQKPGLQWPKELASYLQRTDTGAAVVRVPLRFLKINNDVAIWAAPLELFCEVATKIRAESPFPFTLYFGYSNGWLGYLLTEAEYSYGGYEVTVSPFTARAEHDLTKAVLTRLREMRNR